MAKEILAIPEEYLAEVIRVIRAGLKKGTGAPRISKEVRDALTNWCKDEEEYLKSMSSFEINGNVVKKNGK